MHSSLVAVTKLLAISSAQSLLFLLRISFDVDATGTVVMRKKYFFAVMHQCRFDQSIKERDPQSLEHISSRLSTSILYPRKSSSAGDERSSISEFEVAFESLHAYIASFF